MLVFARQPSALLLTLSLMSVPAPFPLLPSVIAVITFNIHRYVGEQAMTASHGCSFHYFDRPDHRQQLCDCLRVVSFIVYSCCVYSARQTTQCRCRYVIPNKGIGYCRW